MYSGTVKFFDTEKGYGFISDEATPQDFFVHISGLAGQEIAKGDKVVFELAEGPKGFYAIKVKKV